MDDKHIPPEDGAHTDFTNNSLWEEVASFAEGFGLVGIVRLDPPKQAKYVAIRNVREDVVINLKEVQIYQRSRE